jgi:transketolase
VTYYPEEFIRNLEEIARGLRRTSLEMIYHRGAGHRGGCLSAADILTALYFHKMRIDPAHPQDADRDRFILSKGHAGAVLYVALAERGFFPKKDLENWGQLDCHQQAHPERFFDVGIAEAGMVDTAVGLALGGEDPLCQFIRHPALLPCPGADPHLCSQQQRECQTPCRVCRCVGL